MRLIIFGVFMKDGIYKIIFNTNVNRNGMLNGVLTVRDGRINGGDYVCYYKGKVSGNTAEVKSVPHNKHDTNAFNGHSPVDLELRIEEHGPVYLFKGNVVGDRANEIHGELHFLSDLA
jgi:hypothetical protein